MKDIKAARLLTCWKRDDRKTVSVTMRDYDELLFKVPRLFVSYDTKKEEVLYVTLNKEQAIQFLKAEYNLHETKPCQTNS